MKKLLYLFTLLISFSSFGQTALEYFQSAYDKAELKDYYGAIKDWNESIKLNPNNSAAYFNRGFSKQKLKKYNDAISDYNKAIEVDPNNAGAYRNIGFLKEFLGDLNGACADWKTAADLGDIEAAGRTSTQCKEFAIKKIKEAKDLYDLGILSLKEYEKLIIKYKAIIMDN
jgi:tetratricopeptide (TPR) repeat protein